MLLVTIVPLIIFGVCFLVYLVAFMTWTYRVAWNVRALGAEGVVNWPIMAVLWYFVPIFFLFMPYRVMRNVWKASISPQAWEGVSLPGWFGFWWFTSAIASAMGSASFRWSMRENPDAEAIAYLDLATLPFDMASVWLTILLVQKVTAAQNSQQVEKVFD